VEDLKKLVSRARWILRCSPSSSPRAGHAPPQAFSSPSQDLAPPLPFLTAPIRRSLRYGACRRGWGAGSWHPLAPRAIPCPHGAARAHRHPAFLCIAPLTTPSATLWRTPGPDTGWRCKHVPRHADGSQESLGEYAASHRSAFADRRPLRD